MIGGQYPGADARPGSPVRAAEGLWCGGCRPTARPARIDRGSRSVYGHPGRVVLTYNPALWDSQKRASATRHSKWRREFGRSRAEDGSRSRPPSTPTSGGWDAGETRRFSSGPVPLTTRGRSRWLLTGGTLRSRPPGDARRQDAPGCKGTAAAIVAASGGQDSLGTGFRQMKEPQRVAFAPMFPSH